MREITMRSMVCLMVVAGLVLGAGWNGPASAANQREDVLYRLETWKAKHIHGADKAETIAKTLTKLGCEVQRNDHDGHYDVKYRCPKWKKLSLKTHEEAHKWESWLKEYGFQTQHHH